MGSGAELRCRVRAQMESGDLQPNFRVISKAFLMREIQISAEVTDAEVWQDPHLLHIKCKAGTLLGPCMIRERRETRRHAADVSLFSRLTKNSKVSSHPTTMWSCFWQRRMNQQLKASRISVGFIVTRQAG